MKISKEGEGYRIRLSRADLSMLNNCLNEALNIVDPVEFQKGVGAKRTTVDSLLDQINDAYHGRQRDRA